MPLTGKDIEKPALAGFVVHGRASVFSSEVSARNFNQTARGVGGLVRHKPYDCIRNLQGASSTPHGNSRRQMLNPVRLSPAGMDIRFDEAGADCVHADAFRGHFTSPSVITSIAPLDAA